MYPQPQIWRPLVLLSALVGATLFATATVTIAPGDTLSEIAERHGVTVDQLVQWNDLDDPDRIISGTALIVSPPEGGTPTAAAAGSHVVTAGDTLSALARRFGTSVASLVAANGLDDPDHLRIGQTLRLSSGSPTTTATTPRTHTVVAGDTLGTIAAAHGVKTGVLAADNGLADPDHIVIGMVLSIGAPAATTSTTVPTTTVPTTTAPSTTVPTTTVPSTTGAAPSADAPLVAPMFTRWADTYRVPRDLLEAIAWHESSWKPTAVGADGELGILQLSPSRVELIEGGLIGRDLDPLDAEDGIQMGARFLRFLLDRTDSEREAVAAWHQGLDRVRAGGVDDAGAAYADAIEEIRRQRS